MQNMLAFQGMHGPRGGKVSLRVIYLIQILKAVLCVGLCDLCSLPFLRFRDTDSCWSDQSPMSMEGESDWPEITSQGIRVRVHWTLRGL